MSCPICVAIVSLSFALYIGSALQPLTQSALAFAPIHADNIYRPDLQWDEKVAPHWLLLPAGSSTLELQTHIANFQIKVDENRLLLSVRVRYRLYNPSKTSVVSTLHLRPVGLPGSTFNEIPADLTLQANSQALSLQTTDNGHLSTQVQINSDERLVLDVSYSHDLSNTPLPTIAYPVGELATWPGALSLGVIITLPEEVTSESWLQVAPDGWEFAPSIDVRQPTVKWLYEAQVPSQPFIFQSFHPAIWQQIQESESIAAVDAFPANFIRLGDIYRRLYLTATNINATTRDGFYARALAAYSAGLAGIPLDTITVEGNTLHVALASLYRSRILNVNGNPDEKYARLMLDEVYAALAGLPMEEDRRRELVQWQAQGLRILLDAAQSRRDWQDALIQIEELLTLPSDVIDHERLAGERRAVLAQQALQLLEQNDREGAMALAGSEILDAELLPPPAAQSLFVSWQSTVTIGLDKTVVVIRGVPSAERYAEAQDILQSAVTSWATLSTELEQHVDLQTIPARANGTPSLQLSLELPIGTTGQIFAQSLPAAPELALIRSLLEQIAPVVEENTQWLRQNVTLTQPLNLRSVHDQWDRVAAQLEQQALQFASSVPATTTLASASSAEETLRAQIQAVNYRNEAHAWRSLAQNSSVTVILSAATGVRPSMRTWLVTVATPPQLFELQAQFLEPIRLLGSVTVLLLALFLMAGSLWWLL